jgi:5'-3' exoribonuclease 2
MVKKKTAELGMEPTVEWDPSPNICPGTVFMSKLSTALRDSMQKGEFKDIQVILSDSNIPGEGEHKFLKRIRKLFAEEKTRDEELVIYSPDGDMISLALLTHKNNINIMRIPDEKSPLESRFARDYEFIYCDLNILRTDFIELMTKTYNDPHLDAIRLLTDYNFLLFMVGNDFVVSLPFLKIRHGGLDLLIRLYNEIRPQVKDYLVDYHPVTRKIPILNVLFFEKLVLRLAQMESNEMNRHLNNMRKEGDGLTNKKRFTNYKCSLTFNLDSIIL